MENTQLQQKDQKKKAEMIEAFAMALDKHCAGSYEIESVINAMTESSRYLSEQNQYKETIVYELREAEQIIEKHGNKNYFARSRNLFEEFICGMILAGQMTTGTQLIYQMQDDLENVIG